MRCDLCGIWNSVVRVFEAEAGTDLDYVDIILSSKQKLMLYVERK
jgi:hypothetical protein